MSTTDRAIDTMLRLYEVRRTARDLRGENYVWEMHAFKDAIRMHAYIQGIEYLPATIELAHNAQANRNPLAFMLVMAAFVELTEEA